MHCYVCLMFAELKGDRYNSGKKPKLHPTIYVYLCAHNIK